VDPASRTKDRVVVIRLTNPKKEVPLGDWHHLAWVWDRADGNNAVMKIYLDGNEVASAKQAHAPVDLAMNSRTMRIGSLEYPRNNQVGFNGAIDELWVFNTALTPAQVGNLMKFNNIDGVSEPIARGDATPAAPATPVETPVAATPATPSPVAGTPTPVTPAQVTAAPQPDVAPTALPPRNFSAPDVTPAAMSTPSRPGAGKTLGVIACLAWAISLSTFLVWGLKERSRLRAAGKL
jgi:hypothetical protein